MARDMHMIMMHRTDFPDKIIFLRAWSVRGTTRRWSGDLNESWANALPILKSCAAAAKVDKPSTSAHCTHMFMTVLQVALGGAIGAVLRFLAGVGILRLVGPGFPLAVMTVNILGSFAIGMFVVYAAQRGMAYLTPLVMTGLLGGFTTFSAFSLEVVTLFERGSMGQALGYVTLSVVLSIGGLILGLMIARGIWA